MNRNCNRIIVAFLFVVSFLLTSCYKEDIIDIEQYNKNFIKLNDIKCAFDKNSNTYYYPINKLNINNFQPIVEYKFNNDKIILNGLDIKNNAIVIFNELLINEPYIIKIVNGKNIVNEYNLVFLTIPIIEVFTYTDIIDEPKKHAIIRISEPILNTYNKEFQYEFNIGIEIRGGISLGYDKKSYSFELWTDEFKSGKINYPILDLRNDDDWIIDGMYLDSARMRNRVSFDIWNKINNVPHIYREPDAINGINGKFVILLINNKYQGLYCLNEEIDRKQLKLREFYNSYGGVIYKGTGWSDVTRFNSIDELVDSDFWLGWEQKYPDYDQYPYWKPLYEVIDFVVNSTDDEFKNEISNYFNIKNLVDYFIYVNLIKASDNVGKNQILARYDENSTFFFVPWDMDCTWGRIFTTEKISYLHIVTNNLFDRLLSTNANNYKNMLKVRWNELNETTFNIDSLINHYYNYMNLFNENGLIEKEIECWDQNFKIENEINYIKWWIENRKEYLNTYFNDL